MTSISCHQCRENLVFGNLKLAPLSSNVNQIKLLQHFDDDHPSNILNNYLPMCPYKTFIPYFTPWALNFENPSLVSLRYDSNTGATLHSALSSFVTPYGKIFKLKNLFGTLKCSYTCVIANNINNNI